MANGGAEETWFGVAIEGFAGDAATIVTVRTAAGEVSCPIDNQLGILLAAFDGNEAATVLVCDADGEVLGTEEFTPWS